MCSAHSEGYEKRAGGYLATVELPVPKKVEQCHLAQPSARLLGLPAVVGNGWVADKTSQGFLISAPIFGEKQLEFHLITKLLN